jgi:quercetin 2,3-dioxygenase
VLNDDTVAPGMGFGTHPHDNMEIVSIPLSGALEHKDSMGNKTVITAGEVQIMSAGTGVSHSEYNHSRDEEVKFLQIWVLPKERNIKPRYDQKRFSEEQKKNRFLTVISPGKDGEAMWINQDAYFSLGSLDKDAAVDYTIKKTGNGAYIFVLEGEIEAAGETLGKRDGMGVSEADKIQVKASQEAEVLIIEVPMG